LYLKASRYGLFYLVINFGSGFPFPYYLYTKGVNNLSGEIQLGLKGA
jgi:hypothetical protein